MVALTQAERNYPVVLPNKKFSRKAYKRDVYKNGIYKVGLNWAPMCRSLGTTISSSTWESTTTGGTSISLASATSGTLTSYVTVTVSGSGGMETLKNTVTFADGQKEIRLVQLIISDPDCGNFTDYSFE